MTEPTPREWSLPLITLIINSDFSRPNGTHVIEKSAYNAILENLELRNTQLVDEIKALKAERESYRAKLLEIAAIENCDSGYDWQEIDTAREIARKALKKE